MGQATWLAGRSGTWDAAANWMLGTAPLATDDVALPGAADSYAVVGGGGVSASLTLTGNTTLDGAFSTGVLRVGTAATTGALNLSAGATLSAGSASVLYGPLLATGPGTRLVVTGTLTLGAAGTVSARGGAGVQAGGLALAGGGLVSVDASSSFEVGSVRARVAGAITVDAGQSVAGSGGLAAAGGILDQGTIAAQGGAMTLYAAATGSGVLQVGAGASLLLAGYGAQTTVPVAFTGAGGTLALLAYAAAGGGSLLNLAGTVSGFAPGDTIAYTGPLALTGVSFQAGSFGLGTLTLLSGATTIGRLTLAGDFGGYAFQVVPDTKLGAAIGLATPLPAYRLSAGTSTPDLYAWTAGGGGAWGSAGNWTDSSAGTGPAAIAPGSNDRVTIAGPATGAYQLIAGPGNAATLTLLGNTALSGAFTVGTLQVGSVTAAGGLSLSAGSTLGAATATVANGTLQALGTGTRLTVSGALTVAGAPAGNALWALGGGVIRAGSLVLGASGVAPSVMVDAASSIDVGTAPPSAAGAITVEAGRTLSGAGYLRAANGVVDQGTIVAQNGTLVIEGAVTGSGLLQIGAGATLSLLGGAVVPVAFTGPGGTLQLTSAGAGLSAAGTVSGFVAGDTIAYSGAAPLVSVTYQAGGAGLGTLTFNGSSGAIGSLTLAGNFAGLAFQLLPGAGALANVTLVPAGLGTGTASAGTAAPDSYAWLPTTGGNWGSAGNWKDLTTGASPAAVPPGSNDHVTLAGPPGAAQVVAGPGNSADLTLLGNTILVGAFNTGALRVGTATAAAGLSLASGATLNAGSATLLGGTVQASGAGTALAVAGALTLGGAAATGGNALVASAGASVRAGSLLLAPAAGEDSISVDSASTVEIGGGAGATPGMLMVDRGATLAGAGSLAAAGGIVDQGIITAQGGRLTIGSAVTGAGLLQVGDGATLALSAYGAATTATVGFAGAAGTLIVSGWGAGAGAALNLAGTITGFVPGDVIAYAGAEPLTGVTYQPGAAGFGTLTLSGAAGRIGTLTLLGAYSGYAFQLSPGADGATNIRLVPAGATGGAASAGTTTPDLYNWLAAGGGAWADTANWQDVTTGAGPAAVAPGSNNGVTLVGGLGGTAVRVSGPGNAANLAVVGSVALAGSFGAGLLQVGPAAAGALSLEAGTVVAATSASVRNGQLEADGAGSRLGVSGTLTVGATDSPAASSALDAANGGAVQAGGLVLAGAFASVSVDAGSSIEVGGAGGAASGRLTVDAGAVVAGLGRITAVGGIADAGTIRAEGGTLTLASAVTGAGRLEIGAGATLALSGTAPSTAAVAFIGAGGTLLVGDLGGALTEQGLITGFGPGEAIAYAGSAPIDGARYQAGAGGHGTLTLIRAGAAVDTLALEGNFSTTRFVVTPTANGGLVTAEPGGAFAWTGAGGAWGDVAHWRSAATGAAASASPDTADAVTVAGPSGGAYQLVTGPGAAAGLRLLGNTVLSGAFGASSLDMGAAAQAIVGAGSRLAVTGAATVGAALLAAAGGGSVGTGALSVAGGTVRADTGSLLQVGAGAPLGTGVRIQPGATLEAHGGRIEGEVANAGTISNDGALVITGNVTGTGTLSLSGGVTEVQGSLGGATLALSGPDTVLRLHGLYGASSLSAMRFGETVDLAGITGATLSGNVLRADQGTLTLAPAPSGYEYRLYGDAHDGTNLLLHPLEAPTTAVSFTDATAGSSGEASGDDYAGPVDYLQRQFIWAGAAHTLAIKANVPNAFLKGGPGDDALQAAYGNNVLDGGLGSNFLIGGSGADGGRDTFFVDARGGGVTWSTLVHFHQGDLATIWGFGPAGTRPFTAVDGVGGFTGVTIHAETAGAGTGVSASMTFAGVDLATAQQHFAFAQGVLPDGVGYLMIQYV